MLAFVCGAVIVWGPPHTNAQVCGFLVWNLDLHRITEPLGVCVWGRNCVGSESELFKQAWQMAPHTIQLSIEITFLVNNTPVFNMLAAVYGAVQVCAVHTLPAKCVQCLTLPAVCG